MPKNRPLEENSTLKAWQKYGNLYRGMFSLQTLPIGPICKTCVGLAFALMHPKGVNFLIFCKQASLA